MGTPGNYATVRLSIRIQREKSLNFHFRYDEGYKIYCRISANSWKLKPLNIYEMSIELFWNEETILEKIPLFVLMKTLKKVRLSSHNPAIFEVYNKIKHSDK